MENFWRLENSSILLINTLEKFRCTTNEILASSIRQLTDYVCYPRFRVQILYLVRFITLEIFSSTEQSLYYDHRVFSRRRPCERVFPRRRGKRRQRGETARSPRVRAWHVCWIRARPLSGASSPLAKASSPPRSLRRPFPSPLVVPPRRFLEVRSVCTRLAFLSVHRRAFIGLAFAGIAGFLGLQRSLPRRRHREEIAA